MVLAVLVLGLGVWGQMQQSQLDRARADAMMTDGPAAFDAVPVPLILIPFEQDMIPSFVTGDRGTVFGVFARIGGALGLAGILLFSLRGVAVQAGAREEDSANDAEPPSMAAMQAVPTADWQRRLALRMAERMEAPGSARPGSSIDKPARTLVRIVALIMAFCALVLGAATVVMNGDGMPALGLLLDQSIMTTRAAFAGDRAALFAVIKVIALICGLLVLLRGVQSLRNGRAGKGKTRATGIPQH